MRDPFGDFFNLAEHLERIRRELDRFQGVPGLQLEESHGLGMRIEPDGSVRVRVREKVDGKEQEKTYESGASEDKTIVRIDGGNHGFRPSGSKAGDGTQLQQATDALLGWVEKRFPPR